MIRTMTTATNTMGELQKQLAITSNNLANSNTHGYKAQQGTFQELLYNEYRNDKGDTNAPRQSPLGIRYGVGAKIAQTQMNSKQGSFQTTDRQLDFGLEKAKQYFNVIMPAEGGGEKIVYTRQGSFYTTPLQNGQMMLVNDDGNPIADENGLPITFDENVKDYGTRENGVLQITYNDGTVENINLGITHIKKPNFMEHISGTYLDLPQNMADLDVAEEDILTNLQGAEREEIALKNGVLEASNVRYEKEMVDLVNTQRNYQFNARAVSLADQMLGLINGVR